MSSDKITFKCTACEHPVSIDDDNPPGDNDMLKCFGCGIELGRYAELKGKLIELAKAEVDRVTKEYFGKGVTWKK